MTAAVQLTPVKREFAKTSTPLISSCDSGYFGSCAETRFKFPYFSLSPLKESPSKKVYNDLSSLTNTSYIEDTKQNCIRQLRFDDSGWGNDSSSAKESKQATTYPLHQWAVPYRKPKKRKQLPSPSWIQEKVDFLKAMKLRNLDLIISDLLSYIPAKDLVRMGAVSKTWREAIMKDTKANQRIKAYLKRIRSVKENEESTTDASSSDSRLRYEPRLLFKDITNSTSNFAPPPEKKYNTKFESFMREAKNIQAGVLVKCPRCSYAAKPHNGAYKCSECGHSFCQRSFAPLVNDSPMLPIPNLIIGSKHCKKNLRRL